MEKPKEELKETVEMFQSALADLRGWEYRLGPYFTFVEVESPKFCFTTWCRSGNTPKYVRGVKQGRVGDWAQSKGERHTADLLWHYRGDEFGQAAVLIGAFIFNATEGRDSSRWCHGGKFRNMSQLYRQVVDFIEKDDLWGWHHACNEVLPATLTSFHYNEVFKMPEEIEYIGALVALNVAILQDTWQLIRVAPDVQNLTAIG